MGQTVYQWDKLADESDEAYARFLIYRNLGPCRSIKKAYFRYLKEYDNYQGGLKGINPPHSWRAECVSHFWVERAAAWDVRCLQATGARVATLHGAAIVRLAQKNLRAAKNLEHGDPEWDDLMDSLETVAAFLTPELVKGVQERYQPRRPEPIPAAGEQQPKPLHPEQ